MYAIGQGRLPCNNYQVFEIKEGRDETLAVVTVYQDGKVTFELDNDIRYSAAQLVAILEAARCLRFDD